MENYDLAFGVIEEGFNIVNQILLIYLIKKPQLCINLKKVLIILLSLFLSFYISELFEKRFVSLVLNIVIQLSAFFSIVKVEFKEKVIYFIFTIVFETFLFSLLNLIFAKLVYSSGISNLNSMIAMITLFVVQGLIYVNKRRKNEDGSENTNYYIYLFLTIGFLSSLFTIVVVDLFGNKFSIEMNIALFILAISTILANITLYMYYAKTHKESSKYKVELISKDFVLSMQEKYLYDTVESYKELSQFRHDINGYFNTIDGLILNKKYNELHSLIKNLKTTIDKSTQVSCNNIYISATLNQFIHTMKESNIEFILNYDVLKDVIIDNNLLCSLIYNLMSNAIEGCLHNPNHKTIDLSIYEKNKAFMIKIENTVEKNFKLADIKIGKSSKIDSMNHGLGLKNIREIVDRYNGNINYELEDNKLIVYVVLLEAVM